MKVVQLLFFTIFDIGVSIVALFRASLALAVAALVCLPSVIAGIIYLFVKDARNKK